DRLRLPGRAGVLRRARVRSQRRLQPGVHLLQRTERSPPPVGRVYRGELIARTLQEAGQGVVVSGGEGVELVVVAAGAAQREAQERLAHYVYLVVNSVGLILRDVYRRVVALAEPPEARADDRFVEPLGRMAARVGQQVARDMLHHELIVGQIGVQGADHVVP